MPNEKPERDTGSSNHRAQIWIAVITLMGVLGTALFSNWDKLFLPSSRDVTSTPVPFSPTPASTPTPTPSSPTPVPRPTETQTSHSAVPQADLFVSEFALTPNPPIQGRPVAVRLGVYNQGNAPAGAFTVEWKPGENYPAPACNWRIESMAARGGRILECTYAGYPSWYGSINTKITIDPKNEVNEKDESNNIKLTSIQVRQQ